MNSSLSKIEIARNQYHKDLIGSVLAINSKGDPTNADSNSKLSIRIATGIAQLLEISTGERVPGQTSGSKFETINEKFIRNTFPIMNHLRPGHWDIRRIGNRSKKGITEFEQYLHLADISTLAKDNPALATALGREYTITPDVIIARKPISDNEINTDSYIVDDTFARYTPLRIVNNEHPILHASISCKWTIRSDRSQNSRSEALNLIRNRKGPLPHIVVITAEPLPSRIASIALGTGDIDCVYHFALNELKETINAFDNDYAEDSQELLKIMIEGKRLKDISDLPLDLSI